MLPPSLNPKPLTPPHLFPLFASRFPLFSPSPSRSRFFCVPRSVGAMTCHMVGHFCQNSCAKRKITVAVGSSPNGRGGSWGAKHWRNKPRRYSTCASFSASDPNQFQPHVGWHAVTQEFVVLWRNAPLWLTLLCALVLVAIYLPSESVILATFFDPETNRSGLVLSTRRWWERGGIPASENLPVAGSATYAYLDSTPANDVPHSSEHYSDGSATALNPIRSRPDLKNTLDMEVLRYFNYVSKESRLEVLINAPPKW